jgi:hypothetical protein
MLGPLVLIALASPCQAASDPPVKDAPFKQYMAACVVVFPKQPKLSEREMFSDRRVKLHVETHRAAPVAYWIAEGQAPAPGTAPERTLDAARDDVLTALGGRLREERAVERDGRPGRELIVDVPRDARNGNRVALVRLEVGREASEGWFFEVVAVQPAGKRANPKDAERFIASFAPRAAKGTAPEVGRGKVTGSP